MFVIHDEALVRQLEAIAEQKGAQVEDVLREMVAAYPSAEPAPASEEEAGIVPASWEWLVAHLDEASFSTGNPLSGEEAEELLDREFGDYLFNRMSNGTSEDSD
jgi:hypothetical protein